MATNIYKINYDYDNVTIPGGNSITNQNISVSGVLQDSTGSTAAGITLENVVAWSNRNNALDSHAGTGPSLPDNIFDNEEYWDAGFRMDYGATPCQIRFNNLTVGKRYTFVTLPSKTGSAYEYQALVSSVEEPANTITAVGKNANINEYALTPIVATGTSLSFTFECTNPLAASYAVIAGVALIEEDAPTLSESTEYELAGGIENADNEIFRLGDQATITMDYDAADSYEMIVHGAGAAGADLSSGSIATNVWQTPALNVLGHYDITVKMTIGSDTYENIQERKISVVPAYTKGSQPNSYTHNISSNVTLNQSTLEGWGLNTAQPMTVILTGGSTTTGYAKLRVSYTATEAAPLLIINDGLITYTGNANKGLYFEPNCEWIFIDGFGDSLTAPGGAPSASNINPKGYGIVFDTTGTNWNIYNQGVGACKNIHLYGIVNRGGGGMLQAKPSAPVATTSVNDYLAYNHQHWYIHHVYTYQCQNEPFYIGDTSTQGIDNFVAGNSDDCGMDNSAVFRSDIIESGKDAVQVRFCVNDQNFDIHDNVIVASANRNVAIQNSVFALNDGFGGRIFNNIIDAAGNNLTNSCKSWYKTYIYNNVILNLGTLSDGQATETEQRGDDSESLITPLKIDEASGQTFDPSINAEYYLYNNLWHTDSLSDNVLIKVTANGTINAIKWYNNASISPATSPSTSNVAIDAEATNVHLNHADVASSTWNFTGGSYNASTGLYEFVGSYDDKGRYSVQQAYLQADSSLFGSGTDLTNLVSEAPNTGNFPTYGRFTDSKGNVLATNNIGPYAQTEAVAPILTAVITVIPDKDSFGINEQFTLSAENSSNATGWLWNMGSNYVLVAGGYDQETITGYYTQAGQPVPQLTTSDDDLNTADATSDIQITIISSDITTPVSYEVYSVTSNTNLTGYVADESEIDPNTAPDGSGDTTDPNSVTKGNSFDNITIAGSEFLGVFGSNELAKAKLPIGAPYIYFDGNVKYLAFVF